MVGRLPHPGETSATLRGLVPDTSARRPRTSSNGPHASVSSVPCDHETKDTMPIQWRRLPETLGADAPAQQDTVAKSHFRSDFSCKADWCVACHTVSQNINATLLQHATNLLNIIHIHASNADTTFDLAVTVFNNFEFKRDTVQAENDLPAQ